MVFGEGIPGLMLGLSNISVLYDPILYLWRVIFFLLDAIVYSLIPLVYEFCKTLVNLNNLIQNEQEVLQNVQNSIYSLLAIVMFFLLAFSLLSMLANPDKIEDKEKGLSKIFTNIIITLILIVAVPKVFDLAFELQSKIINNQVIEKIFIKDYGTCTTDNCPNLGSIVGMSALSVFISLPADDESDLSSDETNKYNSIFTADGSDYGAVWSFFGDILSVNHWQPSWLSSTEKVFTYGYLMIISTIVGIYILWTFIVFALDIAYRTIKLFVLKLISPIPIVSYMSPGSASKGIFKKWLDEVIKTYLSLFLRIATLAIVGLVLSKIELKQDGNIFINLFLILGLITFLKTAPKMFENIFGITSKSKEEGFGKSLLSGALGAMAAGGASALSGGMSAKKAGYKFGQGAKAGGKAGLMAGAKAGYGGNIMGVVKAGAGGADASAKTYGYKTAKEMAMKKSENNLAKTASRRYDALKNEKTKLNFIKKESDYLDDLRANNNTAELNTYNALNTGEEKRQRRIKYSNAEFGATLPANSPELTAFNNLKRESEREKFQRGYGKKYANSVEYAKKPEIVKALNDVVDADLAAFVANNDVVANSDIINNKQIEYTTALNSNNSIKSAVAQAQIDLQAATQLGDQSKIIEATVNLQAKSTAQTVSDANLVTITNNLNTARSERDILTGKLEFAKNVTLEDAKKHVKAMEDEEEYAAELRKKALIEKGDDLGA